jgi:hypothetical protein
MDKLLQMDIFLEDIREKNCAYRFDRSHCFNVLYYDTQVFFPLVIICGLNFSEDEKTTRRLPLRVLCSGAPSWKEEALVNTPVWRAVRVENK